VARYTDRFTPVMGGVVVHNLEIIKYMKDIEFEVLTDAIKGYPDVDIISKNCRVWRVPPANITTSFANKMFFPQRLLAMKKRHSRKINWLNSSDMDLVHVHGPTIGMEALKADSLTGNRNHSKAVHFTDLKIPKILTMHGLFSPYNESPIWLDFEKDLVLE